jgi:hypothetical protein
LLSETGQIFKLNKMSYFRHCVKVIVKIVVGIQYRREHFPAQEQVPQIGARVGFADLATAVGVERSLVPKILRVLDDDPSLTGK